MTALSLFDLEEPPAILMPRRAVVERVVKPAPMVELGEPMAGDVLDVLRGATVEEFTVILNSPQLERGLYGRVNELLVRLGGKWKRGKGHVYPYDPTYLLSGVIGSGMMPPKNPLAFFPTPNEVIWEMLSYAPLCGSWAKEMRFLEPSAGQGAIANIICDESRQTPSDINMDLVEIDPFRASLLRGQGYKNVFEMDFLDYIPGPVYDMILMNPPFSLKGDSVAYATHILHAYDLLAPEGVILAIVPSSWKQKMDAKSRRLVEIGSYSLAVPKGAFKESGTMVSTEILYITKLRD
jgi:hypothetical protein